MRKPADMDSTMRIAIWTRNMPFSMLIRMSSFCPPSGDLIIALLTLNRYAWYATEVLWSVLCSKDYKEPSDDDDSDS